MEKIAIITDVNAGLDYIDRKLDISVLRSMIHFGDEHYVDGIDMKANEFYEKLQNTDVIPSTSAPTIGEAMDLLDKLVEEGYTDAIMYAISSQMSCICEMMQTLALEYEDKIKLHVFDTHLATYLQGYMAVCAKDMADQGKSVKEILEYSEYLRNNVHEYFVVDDLKYLVKNGRLKSFAGAVAALLKIKPILHIDTDGKIVVHSKVRTHSKAMEEAFNKIIAELEEAKKVKMFVFHTCRENDAKLLMEKIKNVNPKFDDIDVYMVTPAVGAHIGPGILGFGYYILEK